LWVLQNAGSLTTSATFGFETPSSDKTHAPISDSRVFKSLSIQLSAWREDNNPMASFLSTTFTDILATAHARFEVKQDDAILHTMKSEER
jgi:hypothetical protein